jgi:hypothetical protein
MEEGIPENRAQIISPPERWGRWRNVGGNHQVEFNP